MSKRLLSTGEIVDVTWDLVKREELAIKLASTRYGHPVEQLPPEDLKDLVSAWLPIADLAIYEITGEV